MITGCQWVQDRLDITNYTWLASGAYGKVYAKSKAKTRWCVKVGYDMNDAWLQYAMMIQLPEWRDNPFVPKIKFLRINEEKGFYVAVMERLDKTIGNVDRFNDSYKLWDAASQVIHGNFMNDEQRRLLDANPELERLMIALREGFQGIDFHTGNSMVAYDGSLKITDPVHINGKFSQTAGTLKHQYSTAPKNNRRRLAA